MRAYFASLRLLLEAKKKEEKRKKKKRYRSTGARYRSLNYEITAPRWQEFLRLESENLLVLE